MPSPEENYEYPLSGLLYSFSVLDCLVCDTCEEGGAGLGTLGLPEPVARKMTAEAGFMRFTVRDFGNPLNSFYEVRPRIFKRSIDMKRTLLITTIISLAGLWQTVLPQAQQDKEKPKLEQNKAIVRDYMNEIINKGNLAAFDNYFSERVLFNNAGGLKLGLSGMLRSMRAAFPDFHLTIEDQIAEGDKVVTRVTFSGTHQGEFRGIAPTGKKVKYTGIAIDRIADGKVVEMWHVADTSVILQQIGVSPSQPKR